MKYMQSTNKMYLILIFCFLLKSSRAEHSENEQSVQDFYFGLIGQKYANYDTPVIVKELSINNNLSPTITTPICPCASQVKCPPCSINPIITKVEVICHCAPKPICPICPRVSTLHNLAAQKAKEDKKVVTRLRGWTKDINRILNDYARYADDVYKYEMEAKSKAEKVEAASMKAEFARTHMKSASNQARAMATYALCPSNGC